MRARASRLVQAGLVTLGAVGAIAAPVWAADARAKQVTFSKDVAPIFQAKCQECHQPNSIAPMSLITFQEARPWARSIKRARRGAPDAAVAHRPQRRRPEVQERHVAHRRAGGHHRPLGGRRGAAGRSRRICRPPNRSSPTTGGRVRRTASARPTSSIRSSEYTMPAQHQDVWYRPMSDIPITEPRWARMVEIRPDEHEGPEDHPPLDCVSGAEQRSRRRQHRDGERSLAAPTGPTTSSTGVRN